MAFLEIEGKQYEAKMSFKFSRKADSKYKATEEVTGVESIYQNLLSYNTDALLSFWDCATAHYKEQPSLDKIEEALESRIEEEGIENLFKEAFQGIDNSGFFKLQLREFWNNLDMIDKMVKDEKEKEQMIMAKEMFINRRKELNP